MRLDTWVHQVSCNVAKNHSTFQRGNYKSIRFRAGRRKKMFHYSIIAMINEMVCNKRSAYESVNNLFLPLKRLVFFSCFLRCYAIGDAGCSVVACVDVIRLGFCFVVHRVGSSLFMSFLCSQHVFYPNDKAEHLLAMKPTDFYLESKSLE